MVDRSHPYCSVCEGVEGSSLPTDCPGVKLTQEQVAGIYNHTLDYRGDRWDSPGVFDWKPVSMPTAPCGAARPGGWSIPASQPSRVFLM